MISNFLLCVPVFLPLVVGVIMVFLPRRMSTAFRGLTFGISVIMFLSAVIISGINEAGFSWTILTVKGFELALVLKVTPLGKFMLLLAAVFFHLITLYSLGARDASDEKRDSSIYYGSVLIAAGGSAGVFLCDHLVFLFIFQLLVTFALYLLVATGGKGQKLSVIKSITMAGISDATLFISLPIVWLIHKSLIISDMHFDAHSILPFFVFLLLITAAIAKAGAMPLHRWIPASAEHVSAYTMAFLPAVMNKLIGVYLLLITIRGIFDLTPGILRLMLIIIGSATIICAMIAAMVQNNLKKILSFHAISDTGYILLGIATLTPIGIAGGLFHLLNTVIYQCCLFLCVGSAERQFELPEANNIGIGQKMPWTMSAFLTASASASGLPMLSGFVSRWLVFQGIIEMGSRQAGLASGLWPLWLAAAMFGTVLALASSVKIIHTVFLSRTPENSGEVKEVPALQSFPVVFLAVLCIIFGLFYSIPLDSLIYPALGLMEIPVLSLWSSGSAAVFIIICIAIGIFAWFTLGFSDNVREVTTWNCGQKTDNDSLIVPGTDFYDTVTSVMSDMKQLSLSQFGNMSRAVKSILKRMIKNKKGT